MGMAGDEDEERGFKRAATKVYPFDVGHSLGDLRRLVVRQVPSCSLRIAAPAWTLIPHDTHNPTMAAV